MRNFWKNKFLSAAALITLLLFTGTASAQERDPFSPSGAGVISKVRELAGTGTEKVADVKAKTFDSSNPLTSVQLSGYKLIGVLISDTHKLASVKAMNGISYILKVGDSLGAEGGKISDITIDEITVQTESQELKIPVSNKAEISVDGSSDKK